MGFRVQGLGCLGDERHVTIKWGVRALEVCPFYPVCHCTMCYTESARAPEREKR